MDIRILTPDERTISLNVNPRITVEDLKALVEDETRVPLKLQRMVFNEKEMRNSKRLSKYGVSDGDLVQMISISDTVSSSSSSSVRNAKSELGFNPDGSAVNPSAYQQHILNDYNMMGRIYMNDPELAKILHTDDLNWLQLFLRTRHSQRAELKRQLQDPALPFNGVVEAWNYDLQHIPNYVKGEESPYIGVEVNGNYLEVLVDTGAEISVMSERCAIECGLSKLIDTSYRTTIVGVGGQKQYTLGWINISPIKIGNVFCLGSFKLLEYGECIFGMDILRKNQCVVDIKAGVLRIRGGDDVPFL